MSLAFRSVGFKAGNAEVWRIFTKLIGFGDWGPADSDELYHRIKKKQRFHNLILKLPGHLRKCVEFATSVWRHSVGLAFNPGSVCSNNRWMWSGGRRGKGSKREVQQTIPAVKRRGWGRGWYLSRAQIKSNGWYSLTESSTLTFQPYLWLLTKHILSSLLFMY